MILQYNSVRMDVLTNEIDVSNVFDDAGVHVIGRRWHISVNAAYNPDLVSYTHDPREPERPRFDAWGNPFKGGLIVAERRQGRASPILTANSIHAALLEPRKRLQLFEFSRLDSGEGGSPVNPGSENPIVRPVTNASLEVLLDAPGLAADGRTLELTDAQYGPRPICVTVQQVIGVANAFVINFQVECVTAVAGYHQSVADTLLLSNSFSTTHALDESYACVRHVAGTAVFRTDALERLRVGADSFRSGLFPRIPLGWQRGDIEVTLRENTSTIDYGFTDRQLLQTLQDPGAGAANVSFSYTEQLVRDLDAVEQIISSYETVYSLRQLRRFAAEESAGRNPLQEIRERERRLAARRLRRQQQQRTQPPPQPGP